MGNNIIITEQLSSVHGAINGALSKFASGSEETDPMSLFIPEPSEIVWSLIIILILGFAFIKVFLPKVNAILDKRNNKIADDLHQASSRLAQAQSLHNQYTQEIKSAKIEAAEIKDSARIDAAKIVENAHIKGSNEADLILNNARRMIDSERKSAEIELMKHTNSIAMNIVQRMLNNGVENTARQSKIIDQSLNNYETNVNNKNRDIQTSSHRSNHISSKAHSNKSGSSTRKRIRAKK